jgi:hypothetical protein
VGSQSFAIREGRGCECDLTLWAINRELLGGNHRKFIAACSPRAAESQETLHLRGNWTGDLTATVTYNTNKATGFIDG